MKILVSIAMATYNGEKYLKEQLDSIYAQKYKHIEVIVTDDCSTDKTVEILEQYTKSHGLKYSVNEQNIGFVKNFERAITLCQGDYIALSDQDDIWEPNKIEILLESIENDLLIHSDCSLIDEQDNVISPQWKGEIKSHKKFDNFVFTNVVTGCTVLLNRELLKYCLPFPDNLAYHDWWLAIVAAKFERIKYLNKPLVRYRQHNEQDTGISKKTSKLYRFFSNIILRIQQKEFPKMIDYKKQLKNILAIKNNELFNDQESSLISDAIRYYKDYVDHIIHLRHFMHAVKYDKIIRPDNNIMILKNIVRDIIG